MACPSLAPPSPIPWCCFTNFMLYIHYLILFCSDDNDVTVTPAIDDIPHTLPPFPRVVYPFHSFKCRAIPFGLAVPIDLIRLMVDGVTLSTTARTHKPQPLKMGVIWS